MNTTLAQIATFAEAPACPFGPDYLGARFGSPFPGAESVSHGLPGAFAARRDDDNILNTPPAS